MLFRSAEKIIPLISEAFSPTTQVSAQVSAGVPTSPGSSLDSQDGERVHIPSFSADKMAKMSIQDRDDLGWESPDEWEFENQTLAERCKSLKAVQRSSSSGKTPAACFTSKPATSASKGKRAKSVPSSSPALAKRRSARGAGQDAESVLSKEIGRAHV